MFFDSSNNMTSYTSRDVFAKRKENLDEAYQMALQIMKKNSTDEWNIRAFSWCLIDLIKRDTANDCYDLALNYLQQLNGLNISFDDEVLTKNITYVNRISNPLYSEIQKAKELSKNKQYGDSINLYKNLVLKGDQSLETHTSFAWDLYRYSKSLMEQNPPNYNLVKQNLNNYLQLNIEKPSVVNSQMLRIALSIARLDKLDMSIFFRMWGDQFNIEDYDAFITDDGRTLPSLFESILLQALKDALRNNNKEFLIYYNSLLEQGLARYPENIWLVMRKAQVMIALDTIDEAKKYARELVKQKNKEYWAWEVLGDIYIRLDINLGLACYSKALLCSQDMNFIGKLKIKIAEVFAKLGDYSAAKYELISLIEYRNNNGQKIPNDAGILQESDWFINTTVAKQSNKSLYLQYSGDAEALLYDDIEWQKGTLGETFIIERNNKSRRTMRKVYIEHPSDIPEELSVLESEIKFLDIDSGKAVKLKIGKDQNERIQVYMLKEREGELWDIFIEKIGVVDNVNIQKKLIHFIVDKKIDGVISFRDTDSSFSVGDTIVVKLSQYRTKKGIRYRVLNHRKTDSVPAENILRLFREYVDRISGFGFTSGDIFIPESIVQNYNIQEKQIIEGRAIISFDKKHSRWGWQVIDVICVHESDDCF